MDNRQPQMDHNWFRQIAEMENTNKSLAARIRQLEAENDQLKNVMQQKEDFVVALSHDLKNPLLGATQALELLSNGALSPKDHDELLCQLIDSNKGMLRMLWNVLEVYRHDAGVIKPLVQSLQIRDLINQCLAEFNFNLKAKNIDVSVRCDRNLPELQTDPILLRRVLINLLDNAVKFTPREGKLDLAVTMEGGQMKIAIADSGPGMSCQQMKRMFERFWQTEHGRAQTIGTGLGLFLSNQIVQLLGGKIECHSTESVGTEFSLYLEVGDKDCQKIRPFAKTTY